MNNFRFETCLQMVTSYKGHIFVLTLCRWYRVEQDYVNLINRQLKDVDLIKEQDFMPKKTVIREDEYNKNIEQVIGAKLMDKNCYPIPGETKLEVCDLFSAKNDFIHVKHYTGSATLSHLFSQGSVSASLFCSYIDYRKFIREQLPVNLKKQIPIDGIDCSKYRVVYAISAKPTKAIPNDLPFFSKVNLLFHKRIIERMGFRVSVYHIIEEVADEAKATGKRSRKK